MRAATASAMTDVTKIYVYTGSESGYTAGHWYYYDGSSWADGGVYNSVAFVTDKTLTGDGEAADAKVTGDDITDLKSAINNFESTVVSNYMVQQGEFKGSTWTQINSNYKHIAFPIKAGDIVSAKCYGGASFYAVVKSYSVPVYGDTVDFSSSSGFTTYLTLSNNGVTFTAPQDAKYLLVLVYQRLISQKTLEQIARAQAKR